MALQCASVLPASRSVRCGTAPHGYLQELVTLPDEVPQNVVSLTAYLHAVDQTITCRPMRLRLCYGTCVPGLLVVCFSVVALFFVFPAIFSCMQQGIWILHTVFEF